MSGGRKRHKILYIQSSSDLYGAARCLLELLKQLPPEYEPIVVLPSEGPLAGCMRDLSIRVVIMPLGVIRRQHVHPIRIFAFITQFFISIVGLVRLITREKVELVQCNTSLILPGSIAAFLCRRPCITHVRELLPEKGILTWLYLSIISATSCRIFCVSNAVREQLRPRSMAKAVVVHDGIDILAFVAQAPSGNNVAAKDADSKDGFVVGMIGRISFGKGQDIFIKASKLVSERWNTRFLIIGDIWKGNKRYEILEKDLHALVDKLGIEERVEFTGFRDDTAALLSTMDVFVCPSVVPEGLGIVLLEAMAMGKPVVATNQGGPKDVVIDSVTGLLVPPSDWKSLAEAISLLLGDRRLRERYGEEGRKRVAELFSIEAHARKIVSVYREILADTG